MKYNAKEIREKLTIGQIEDIVAELGGEPQRHNNILTCRTICHGGDSHKLYYYDNSKTFSCYTSCGSGFDIFELILKIKDANNEYKSFYNSQGKQEHRAWQLHDAIEFVAKYFNISAKQQTVFDGAKNQYEKDEEVWNKYEQLQETQTNNIKLQIYDDKILKFLPKPRIGIWEKEGITSDIIKEFNIMYNPKSQGIVIPHYNKDGELIGIRERTLVEEFEKYGKYKPSILNNKMYNHPLGFNLYGLNKNKETIKIMKTAIVFEGEKSVLKYGSMVGQENNIAVACCGSSLVEYQVNLLRELNIDNIIIGLDKQYHEYGDEEYFTWEKKYKDIAKKCRGLNVSFLIDTENILNYKDSPVDKGWDDFYKLFNERKVIKNGV